MSKRAHADGGLRPGRRIGPYVLSRLIGSGATAEVWRAEESGLARTVALKVLHAGLDDLEGVANFAREARSGGQLNHHNLVATYDFGEDDGFVWIAQEYVEGAWTLADFLRERRRADRLPRDYDREVARRIASLADGLEAAHAAGIIHRDVKPANVLLDADGEPRLADFGLARPLDPAARSAVGAVAGSWAYMSPEQVRARGDRVDHRSDLFSLGVVLYELLTLRRPFEGDTVQRTADRILHDEPADPRGVRSGCPRDLATICLKCLEKDPARRYPSAAELARDLRRFLVGEPILARPPGAVDRARRWARRHPVIASAVTVGTAALTVLSVLLAGALRDARAMERLADDRAELLAETTAVRDAVARLSVALDVERLLAEQAELWPPHPAQVPRYEEWIRSAESVATALPVDAAALDELRRVADDPDLETRRWLQRLLAILERAPMDLREVLLKEGGRSLEHGWSVPDRLAFARRLERELEPGGVAAEAWKVHGDAVRAAVGPGAPELEPADLMGLVPLGADPDSGLMEFAHTPSGEVPVRAADGRLLLDESSAVVLVLLPGGRGYVGEQSTDPQGPHFEPDPVPVAKARALTEVEVPAFLIGKFELTAGQWERLAGEAPDARADEDRERAGLLPSEGRSFAEFDRVLRRVGLQLPEETWWEWACRAGGGTRLAGGDVPDALSRMNLRDRSAFATGADWAAPASEAPHDDGFVHRAPVGTWPPNAFGLHDVHGNVAELCGGFDPDGARCVSRGGGYMMGEVEARSSTRIPTDPTASREAVGARAAMAWRAR